MGHTRAVAAIAFVAQGCSFTMRTAPNAPAVEEVPDCTDSVLPPIVDTAVALLLAPLVVASINEVHKPQCGGTLSSPQCGIQVPLLLADGGIFVAAAGGAIYGWRERHLCRTAYDAHDEWALAHRAPSAPVAPSPAPHKHGPYRWLVPVGLAVAGAVIIGGAIYIGQNFHL